MKKSNLGDSYSHRVTLRLSDSQFNFLIQISDILGVTPSEYLRMVVNTGMVSTKSDIKNLADGNMLKGMVGTNENVKTNIDNIV